jgi:hypothetical protein
MTATAAPARGAPPAYVLADGSVSIIGNDGMDELIARLGRIVARDHPGMKLAVTMKGSSTGLPALAAGTTLFAPLAREAWRGELAGFRQIHDYDATPIRIGYSGWGRARERKRPPQSMWRRTIRSRPSPSATWSAALLPAAARGTSTCGRNSA